MRSLLQTHRAPIALSTGAVAGKADQQQIATLKNEILALRKEHNSGAPHREDFNFNNPRE
ncbi:MULTISPECIES: hypothetical protein [unclassified Comamonas]|uniref:hypothetical protein n=1 Tax=unclassified Comamonas TaxID=2638500 RepID=UPI001F088B44|nr:hypothetical protein [Comamonas sp. lk]